jgi:lipoprotein NlpI
MLRTLLFLTATAAVIAADPPIPADFRKEMIGRFEKERTTLDAAIEKEPENIKFLTQRGDIRQFLADFKGAIADFEKEIALDPAHDAPHWRLGIAYYFAGEYEKSAKQFAKYHSYDDRDRENGVWHFMANARVKGIEAARKEMLEYTKFDREPFPSIYELLAGKKTGAEILAEIEKKELTKDVLVNFFAHYYIGVNEDIHGRKDTAREHLAKAVALSRVANTGGGPGYMGQAARLHLEQLK